MMRSTAVPRLLSLGRALAAASSELIPAQAAAANAFGTAPMALGASVAPSSMMSLVRREMSSFAGAGAGAKMHCFQVSGARAIDLAILDGIIPRIESRAAR